MSCGVGRRCGSDLAWMWLAAVAQIQPLAWGPPYAADSSLKKKNKKDKKKKERKKFNKHEINELYDNTKQSNNKCIIKVPERNVQHRKSILENNGHSFCISNENYTSKDPGISISPNQHKHEH